MKAQNNKPSPYKHQGKATYTPAKRAYAKKKRKALRRFFVLCLSLVVLFVTALVLVEIIQNRADADDVLQQVQSVPVSSPQANTVQAASEAPVQADIVPTNDSAWNFLGNVVPPEERGTPIGADKRMYALPENGRVSREYFNTVVFVGDSITQGLHIYGGLNNASFCDYKGVSPKQIYDGSLQQPLRGEKEVPLDAIVAAQPDNVYVLLGTNAMVGMSNEALLTYYEEMLKAMRERLDPAVCIYVQSITPVLEGVDNRFHMEDFIALNNALAQMAFENGMFFLDLHEALAGDDGWLRSDYGASDGYHMKPAGYAAWVEYLVTHTAYNTRHAHLYEENPEPFRQLPPVE